MNKWLLPGDGYFASKTSKCPLSREREAKVFTEKREIRRKTSWRSYLLRWVLKKAMGMNWKESQSVLCWMKLQSCAIKTQTFTGYPGLPSWEPPKLKVLILNTNFLSNVRSKRPFRNLRISFQKPKTVYLLHCPVFTTAILRGI